MNWLKSRKTIVVHDGNFHPDDVFAVAALSILNNGNVKVTRTREESEIAKADYVVDVGHKYDPAKNRFDHHQDGGAGFRDGKISYSAFALVWQTYGEKVCGSKKVADILDKKIVAVVDADDDGLDICQKSLPSIKPFMMVDVIYAMRPTWKEADVNINKIFLEAVAWAEEILLREIKIAEDNLEAEGLVTEIYNKTTDKRVIVFDKIYLPKPLLYKYPEPLFVIYLDRSREMWRVTTIEKGEGTYECRKNFPETWWGKKDDELAKITGVADAVFCRNKGIFAGAKSQAGAIKLAQLALQTL
jgi:uncharacterized UPF0160 family protein